MVDRALILRKIAELELYQRQVAEYAGTSVDEYQSDWKTQRIVERTLQMMIEVCVDIANHIIADDGLRAPDSYSDSFRVLFESGIINDEIMSVMEKMSKFRNIVVHQYERVDAEIVVLILRKHLDDFAVFKESVLSHLAKSAPL